MDENEDITVITNADLIDRLRRIRQVATLGRRLCGMAPEHDEGGQLLDTFDKILKVADDALRHV
jgi:hypothetical protein